MSATSIAQPRVVRAGVYTRISSDPSGQRAGVERQRADCEAHCLARGWTVAEIFEDNDSSASNGRPRRAYERMLAAVEAGPMTPSSRGTTTAYTAARRSSRRHIDRLRASADAATRRRTVLHPDPRAFWAEADFAQRRETLALVVERVVVAPGRPGMGRFDQSRVRVGLTPWAPAWASPAGRGGIVDPRRPELICVIPLT